jgi:hypothetical protein
MSSRTQYSKLIIRLCFLALLLLLAGLLYLSKSSLNNSVSSDDLLVFNDSNSGLRFSYPASWKVGFICPDFSSDEAFSREPVAPTFTFVRPSESPEPTSFIDANNPVIVIGARTLLLSPSPLNRSSNPSFKGDQDYEGILGTLSTTSRIQITNRTETHEAHATTSITFAETEDGNRWGLAAKKEFSKDNWYIVYVFGTHPHSSPVAKEIALDLIDSMRPAEQGILDTRGGGVHPTACK